MADSPLIAGMVPASGGAAGSPAAPAAPSTSALIAGMKPASGGGTAAATASPLVSTMMPAPKQLNTSSSTIASNLDSISKPTPVLPTASKPVDTSSLFSGFAAKNNFTIPSSNTETSTPIVKGAAASKNLPDDSVSLPKNPIAAAGNLANDVAIKTPGELLGNTPFMQQAAAGIDAGSVAGNFGQNMLNYLSTGLEGLHTASLGLYNTPHDVDQAKADAQAAKSSDNVSPTQLKMLDLLGPQITSQKADIDRMQTQLTTLGNKIQSSRNKVDTTSSSAVASFNQLIAQYQTTASQLQDKINVYNGNIATYQKIAGTYNSSVDQAKQDAAKAQSLQGDWLYKTLSVISSGIGAAATGGTLGEAATGGTTAKAAIGALSDMTEQLPLVGKYIAPYIQPLINNMVATNVITQMDPSLGTDIKKRAAVFLETTASAPLYTALGAIDNPLVGLPASFALGFGMAKLSGASNGDAARAGTAFALLDAFDRLNKSGNSTALTKAKQTEVNGKQFTNESLSILQPYSTTPLTENSSPEEIKAAYYKAVHQTHPDVGGTQEKFVAVKNAYEYLTKAGTSFNGASSNSEEKPYAKTDAEQSVEIFSKEVKDSIEKNGPMVTHQALQDNLGLDSAKADTIVKANTTAPSSEDMLKSIITPEGQPLKGVDLKQPTRLSAEQAAPLAAKAAAHYYIAKIAPAIKEGRMVNLNADDLKKYFGEDYNDNNHPIYSQATIQIAARALKENKDSGVIMLGGGPGSGKSEILAKTIEEQGFKGIVYDSNLSNPEGARKFMQMARDAGKDVRIVGMIPNLEKARGFTLQREEETKRGITDNTFANGHFGFPDTTRQLLEAGDIKEEHVKLLDSRAIEGKATAKAAAAANKYVEKPLALLQSLGYNKEEIKQLYAKENYTKNEDGTFSRRSIEQDVEEQVAGEGSDVSSSKNRASYQRGFVAPGKVAEDIAAGVQQLKDIIEHHQKIEILSTGISNNLYKNEGADTALQVRMAQLAIDARKLSTVEEREHVFHYMEDHNYPLTDKEREIVLPLVQEMHDTLDVLSHQAKELGAYIPGFIKDERIPRHIVDKDGVVDRALKSFEEGKKFIQNGGRLTTSVGSASKRRVYHQLTNESTGEKTLAAIKDKKVTQIVKGKSKELGTLKLQKNEDLLNNQIRPLQRQITSMQNEIATLKSVKAGSTGIEGKLAEIERKALSISVSTLDIPDIRDNKTVKKDAAKLKALMHDINLLSKVKDGEDIILRDQRIETLTTKMVEASNAMADIEAHFDPNTLDKKVHVAPDGERYIIGQATSLQIEANTKDRVYKDPLMAYGLAITRTAKVVRNLEFLNKLKETDQFKDAIVKEGDGDIPDGYRQFKSPIMRGYWGELRVVEAFDDMATRAGEGAQDLGLLSDIYQGINNFLVETIVLNPLMHFPNLAVNRGSELFAAGAMPDVHFLDTLKQVLNKDDEYLTWVEHGAPFQYIRQSNSEYTDAMMEDIVKEAQKNASEIAPIDKVLGWTGKPFHWLAQVSSDTTWVGNDVILFNALKTYQKATGASYEKTIEEVTKRMADYRIPSRILGSRLIAKVVQSKNFFIFGAYHFSGVLKPWITSLGDGFTPFGEEKGGANAQQRYAAYRTLAYFALLYYIYQITDEVLQKETGNPNTYTSMTGPMRLPQNIGKSITQKSPVPIISSLLTLNPAINIVGSIMTGYDFSNFFKPVFGPGGEGVTAVLANQASIYQGVSGAFQGTGSWTDYALTFGGVYTPKTTQQNSLVNSMLNLEKPQVEAQMKADIANGNTTKAEAEAKDFNDRLKTALSSSLKSIGKSGDDAQVQYYLTQFPNGLGAKGYAIRMPSATSMANYEAKMGFSSAQKLYGASAGNSTNKGIPSSATNTTNPGSVNFVSPNDVTLYNRMSNESAVKAALSGGKIQPNTQLDHIVALEGGGTNEVTNIQIIPTAMDNVNQPVEDFIGQQVKAGKMDLAQSTEISIRFKAGLGQPLTQAMQDLYHSKYGSQPLTLAQVYDYANNLTSK